MPQGGDVTGAHGPLRLQIPQTCPLCAAVGRVILEPTAFNLETVLLHWRCTRCQQSWPVTAAETGVTERRQGAADRRRQPTRKDRRKS